MQSAAPFSPPTCEGLCKLCTDLPAEGLSLLCASESLGKYVFALSAIPPDIGLGSDPCFAYDISFLASRVPPAPTPLGLVALAAPSIECLAVVARDLSSFIRARGIPGDDVETLAALCSATTAAAQPSWPRLAVIAPTASQAADHLAAFSNDPHAAIDAEPTHDQAVFVSSSSNAQQRPVGVCWMCSGQCSATPTMGLSMYRRLPAFREAVDRCAAVADPLLRPIKNGRGLLRIMWPTDDDLRATPYVSWGSEVDYGLFTFEYALAHVWLAMGFVPDVLIGHRLGDFTAAALSGVMGLKEVFAVLIAREEMTNRVGQVRMHCPSPRRACAWFFPSCSSHRADASPVHNLFFSCLCFAHDSLGRDHDGFHER